MLNGLQWLSPVRITEQFACHVGQSFLTFHADAKTHVLVVGNSAAKIWLFHTAYNFYSSLVSATFKDLSFNPNSYACFLTSQPRAAVVLILASPMTMPFKIPNPTL